MTREKKFTVFITVFVIIMTTTIMILAYQIEGVNRTALWFLFLPLVVVRTIRCILLINTK